MLSSLKLPRINDITTDLTDPPFFTDAGSRKCSGVSYPESFKPKVAAGYPDLQPLRLSDPPAAVFAKALELAKSTERWTDIHASEDTGLIEAVASTPIIGFRDDIVIRIQADGDGTRVDIRSRSRVGKHDFGANATRIRTFFKRLN